MVGVTWREMMGWNSDHVHSPRGLFKGVSGGGGVSEGVGQGEGVRK